jgi:hypothetical protein
MRWQPDCSTSFEHTGMRIGFIVNAIKKHIRSRVLAARLDRIGGRDSGSFDFLKTELELGLVLASLAGIEYGEGHEKAAQRSHSRAEQIYTALLRFLPRAQLNEDERAGLEAELDKLQEALTKLPNQFAPA